LNPVIIVIVGKFSIEKLNMHIWNAIWF
jgi:hypothetical protein